MQDQLYLMTYVKMNAYWKDEIQSWFPSETQDRILAIAACAHSDDIRLPKIILSHMIATIIKKDKPDQVEITEIINQDKQLKVSLIMNSNEYINLCRILDNFENTKTSLLTQGWSFSDRRNVEIIISRKDLTMACKNKIRANQAWYTQLYNALLAEVNSFLAPAAETPKPEGIGSSKMHDYNY